MNEKIKFDPSMLEDGTWTEDQKYFIRDAINEIELALRKRFPNVADSMKLNYYLPEEGVGAKITVSYEINDDIHLGEHASSSHLIQVIRNEPEKSKDLLKSLLNNHSTFIYEKVIVRALTEQLNNLTMQSEQYPKQDIDVFVKKGVEILPSGFVPEGKILLHPNTLEIFKKEETT